MQGTATPASSVVSRPAEAPSRVGRRVAAIPYVGVVFLGAFLLFQIQPILGRYILPWFGGGSAVWTSCLLFFQLFLLAGYGYAHVLARLSPRLQVWIHVALLLASLTLLPIRPLIAEDTVASQTSPTVSILLLLTTCIGLPYALLSATGPLLQRWFASKFSSGSPYRLFVVSNSGSLLALITYPVAVEPTLSRGAQTLAWSLAYLVFCVGSVHCALDSSALRTPREGRPVARRTAAVAGPKPMRVLGWLAQAAFASALLMATTNQLTQDVAPVPFLWILPLALYLLTFMICFDRERWYDRRIFGPLLFLALAAAVWALRPNAVLGIWLQIAIHCLAMFACCMVCHGELARAKPAAERLTLFYLTIAAGGAIGGIGVSIVAPKVLDGFWEYPIALAGCFTLAGIAWLADTGPGTRRWGKLTAICAFLVADVALCAVLAGQVHSSREGQVASTRGFYGALRIVQRERSAGRALELYNGHIKHGTQFLEWPLRRYPTTYYGPKSGVGAALLHHPERERGPLEIGVVGLGAGTIAAYGRPGDRIRFYEINPQVVAFARQHLTYLSDSRAAIEVVLGDARNRMQEELLHSGGSKYDALVIDAFTGDAVPQHLLTAEAAELYWSLLKPHGVLLVHISNRYLDLVEVARGMALHLGIDVTIILDSDDDTKGTTQSAWAMLARDTREYLGPEARGAKEVADRYSYKSVVWTDEFASLWSIFHVD